MPKKRKPNEAVIRKMTIADYPKVFRLWKSVEGLSLVEDDSRKGIALYLKRNPKLCFVAQAGKKLIGAVLCGHDGRRGIMRHLAVQNDFRGQGIALMLVQKSLMALARAGIKRCNIFVADDNRAGAKFWEHIGFRQQPDSFSLHQISTEIKLTRRL